MKGGAVPNSAWAVVFFFSLDSSTQEFCPSTGCVTGFSQASGASLCSLNSVVNKRSCCLGIFGMP